MTPRADVWKPDARADFAGPILIDTHIWLWYLDGAEAMMSAEALHLLKRCVRGEGILISDISVWEIANKVSKGRLALQPSVAVWLERAQRRPGFAFVPLDRDILLLSNDLPGAVHGDPADRMLIASAILTNTPLVTADRSIIDYALAQGGFSVCDARP